MFQRRGQARVRDMVLLGGWLFADLLLGLMMIFLISIKGGSLPLPSCGTPTAVQAATALSTGTGNALGSAGRSALTPSPTGCPTPTPTQTPTNCGLDNKHEVDLPFLTIADIGALERHDATAQADFNNEVKGVFAAYPGKIAGLVEVFGGDPNIGAGQTVAQAAIAAMTQLTTGQVSFFNQTTLFQDFGDQKVPSGQVRLAVFFYLTSATGKCQLLQP
jgi:hypothetical protein